jgi:hypothetical protein
VTEERGQVSVLIVGFAIILILAVGVVADASAAYLQRQRLDNLADGAALAGADEVRSDPLYTGGLDDRAPIDPEIAGQAVRDYLRRIDAYADHPGLRFVVSVRDRSVVVSLRARLDLPITVGGTTETQVTATGSAAVVINE